MMIQPPFYPIIYVRGFATTMSEIEDAAASPYMGFNDGATKIRQRHDGEIVRFIFESPLLRLIKDEGYIDTYRDGSELTSAHECPPRCIWIFRYYEQASAQLGRGERQSIPEIAQDLRRLILLVRERVCGNNRKQRDAFRVHLVAHSMGGLICRAYLQNLCVHGTGSKSLDRELELDNAPGRGGAAVPDDVHLVDKVFAYATPHNGVDFLGFNAPDVGSLDAFHIRNFNRETMHEYLRLPGKYKSGADVNSLNGAFPAERFFCFLGSNHNDYTAFFKLSRRAVGPMSDGLVLIRNAYIENAPRAFAHRSHSGHFGIVNSEEGYQNLRRFLFGDLRIEAHLLVDELTLPRPVEYQKAIKKQRILASYHIDTAAQVRGGKYFLHERRFDQASSILQSYDSADKETQPLWDVHLFTGYLLKRARTAAEPDEQGTELAFAIHVEIRVPMYEVDKEFWFDHHFEGGPVFSETVTFHLEPPELQADVPLRYGLASRHGVGEAPTPGTLRASSNRGAKEGTMEIPLGFAEEVENPPRPGFRGRLRLMIAKWNARI
jgi:hypothetical protein